MKQTHFLTALGASLFLAGAAQALPMDYIGLYTFEDGTASDSSANGNDGTVVGGVTFLGTGSGYDGGRAAQFTPTAGSSGISLPINISASAMPAMTMGAWVKAFSLGTSNPGQTGMGKVLSHDNGGFDRTVGLDFRGDDAGTNFAAFNDASNPGGSYGVIDMPGEVDLNVWNLITVTYDGSFARLYVDGAEVATGTDGTDTGIANLFIGANPGFNEDWDGLIDDVFVYDRALSSTEIEDIYAPAPIPLPASLPLLLAGLAGMAWMRKRRG